jgi:hypothetical protein
LASLAAILGRWALRKSPAVISRDHEHHGAFFFSAHVIVDEGRHSGPVNMLLDTGASQTIIGEDDLTKLGVDITSIPRSPRPIAGWGGVTESFIIERPCVILIDEEKKSEPFPLDEMLCGRNPRHSRTKSGQKHIRTVSIPSVIGRDFLKVHGLIVHIDIRNEDVYLYTTR